MDRRHIFFYTTFTISILSTVSLISLYFIGYRTFAILGVYAVIPLALSPLILYIVLDIDSYTNYNTNSKIYWISFLVAFTLMIITGMKNPRPDVFFISSSIGITVPILFNLRERRNVQPLLMASIIVITFHISTTATNSMWIGSGDGAIIWTGVKNLMTNHDLTVSAGYSLWPNYFILVGIIGFVTSLSAKTALLTSAALIAMMSMSFLSLFGRDSVDSLKKHWALPAIIAPLLYKFNDISTYSIPSTAFALLSFIVIYYIYRNNIVNSKSNKRILAALFIYIISLGLYHRAAHVWLITIAILVFIISYVFNIYITGDYYEAELFENIVRGPMFLLVIIFTFLFSRSGLANVFLFRLINLFTQTVGGKQRITEGAAAKPIGLLSTFIDSSIVLIMFLALIIYYTYNLKNVRRDPAWFITVISSVILAVIYFPGPLYLLNFEFYRLSRFAVPFIALSAAIGLVLLWKSEVRAMKYVIVALLLTNGMFVFANDIYSRDNPVAKSGTFTNYMDETDRAATEFSFSMRGQNVSYDLASEHYWIGRSQATNWGDPVKSDRYLPPSIEDICQGGIIFDRQEMRDRGKIVYGHLSYSHSEEKFIAERELIYNNGENTLYTKCYS